MAKIDDEIKKQEEKLKQLKAKKRKAIARENQAKRVIENRVKYILGGYVLKEHPEIFEELKKSKLRDYDRKTIEKYLV